MTKQHLEAPSDTHIVETDPVDARDRRRALEERARIGARVLGAEDASLSAMATCLDALRGRTRDTVKE